MKRHDTPETFRKIHAYALATDSGFGTLGVFINGDGKPRIGIIAFHPQGTDLYLTAEEAELWLSGYVTGRNGANPNRRTTAEAHTAERSTN